MTDVADDDAPAGRRRNAHPERGIVVPKQRKKRTVFNRHNWTDHELMLLKEGFANGTPAQEIADAIGVTVCAAYQKAHVTGLGHKSRQIPLLERFMNFVIPEPNSGCWLWLGTMDPHGYAKIGMGHNKRQQASHIAMRLFRDGVPDGFLVMHRCDNPACVNPDHLTIGTHKDNAIDKIKKGRWRGPDHPITMSKWMEKLLLVERAAK